jgi:hypothetical protein
MPLKLTQFSQTPATRSTVCPRCGYRMFHTKRFNWVCGPGCDGAEQSHQLKNAPQMPQSYSPGKESLADQSMN